MKHTEKKIENKEISRNAELSEKANKSVLKSQKEKTDKMWHKQYFNRKQPQIAQK